jgi:hypothetical protein
MATVNKHDIDHANCRLDVCQGTVTLLILSTIKLLILSRKLFVPYYHIQYIYKCNMPALLSINLYNTHYIINLSFRIVFWDVLLCKIIVDRRFKGACCLHHQG